MVRTVPYREIYIDIYDTGSVTSCMLEKKDDTFTFLHFEKKSSKRTFSDTTLTIKIFQKELFRLIARIYL